MNTQPQPLHLDNPQPCDLSLNLERLAAAGYQVIPQLGMVSGDTYRVELYQSRDVRIDGTPRPGAVTALAFEVDVIGFDGQFCVVRELESFASRITMACKILLQP